MTRMTWALVLVIFPNVLAAHDNEVHVTKDNAETCIASNGAPNHSMGKFPNRANPNRFEKQQLQFCFPSNPQLADHVTEDLMTVGVTLTGLPIRPYTAGYYDPDGRRGFSRDPSSGWRQQAMFEPRRLGMDDQNAHVDRSGLYHYHAVSMDYLRSVDGTHIGFAPDGFELHYAGGSVVSSWALKVGERPTVPFGKYDGTFEEDFEFLSGSGDLDACNGKVVNGVYTYFATDSYPYFPRCFKGEIAGRFMTRGR